MLAVCRRKITTVTIMEEVKLYGALIPSPFVYRVIWALKLKEINYTEIQENLYKKSDDFLKLNPVHKLVPVLVHGGKPISESTVILEYIEETWPEKPLLPKDPYERAKARFWIKFVEDKLINAIVVFGFAVAASGEKQEKGTKELFESLKTVEEHSGVGKHRFFGGDEIGMVDLVLGIIAHWLRAIEEIVGFKVFEPLEFPLLHKWAESFKEVPAIKENLPDYERLVQLLIIRRNYFLTGIVPPDN